MKFMITLHQPKVYGWMPQYFVMMSSTLWWLCFMLTPVELTHCGQVVAYGDMGRHWLVVYCLMALGHYLNQCWLLINDVLWHSPEGKVTVSAQLLFCIMSLKIMFEKYYHISQGPRHGQVETYITENNTKAYRLLYINTLNINGKNQLWNSWQCCNIQKSIAEF